MPDEVSANEIVPVIERKIEGELPPEFMKLPADVQRAVLSKVGGAALSITLSSWDGDYPPPSIIDGYENVQKGLADRIFKMAEADLAHGHFMERRLADYVTRGQFYGFMLATVSITGSVLLIYNDKQIAGSALGAAVIIPLVTLFVRGQIMGNPLQNQSAELESAEPTSARKEGQNNKRKAGKTGGKKSGR